MRLRGTAAQGRSTPRLSTADVVLPAAQAIAGTGPTRITYYAPYRKGGFTGSNTGRVWAATVTGEVVADPAYSPDLVTTGAARDESQTLPRIGFGGDAGDVGSDRAGGFVQPSLTIAGMSLRQGPVGDLATVATGSVQARGLPRRRPAQALRARRARRPPPRRRARRGTGPHHRRPRHPGRHREGGPARRRHRAGCRGPGAARPRQGVGGGRCRTGGGPAAPRRRAGARRGLRRPRRRPPRGHRRPGRARRRRRSTAALDAAPNGLRPRLTTAAAATRALSRPPMPLFGRTRLEQVADALDRFARLDRARRRRHRLPAGPRPGEEGDHLPVRVDPDDGVVAEGPATAAEARAGLAGPRRARHAQGVRAADRRGPRRAARLPAHPLRLGTPHDDPVRAAVVQGRLLGQGRGRRRHGRHRLRRLPVVRPDDQGAHPPRRLLRPAERRGHPRRA